jgi:hypothetical protein
MPYSPPRRPLRSSGGPTGGLSLLKAGTYLKLDTTALYTRVATKTIREIMSPLDHITRKLPDAEPPILLREPAPTQQVQSQPPLRPWRSTVLSQ